MGGDEECPEESPTWERLNDCDMYAPGKAVSAKGRVLVPCAMAGKRCGRHRSPDCAAIYDFGGD